MDVHAIRWQGCDGWASAQCLLDRAKRQWHPVCPCPVSRCYQKCLHITCIFRVQKQETCFHVRAKWYNVFRSCATCAHCVCSLKGHAFRVMSSELVAGMVTCMMCMKWMSSCERTLQTSLYVLTACQSQAACLVYLLRCGTLGQQWYFCI